MKTISQKFVRSLLLLGLLAGITACKTSDSYHSQNPTDPTGGLVIWQSNFSASRGISDGFGVYKGHEYFQIQVPAGDYLLTYRTNNNTFYIVFHAPESARLLIGLQSGDEVLEATVYHGTILDTSNADVQGTVTLYSELGASGAWNHLFSIDPSIAGIPLIGGVGVNYVPGVKLELYIPVAGKYLLTYRTTLGTFQFEFETTEDNMTQVIGLTPGDEVIEAYILKL